MRPGFDPWVEKLSCKEKLLLFTPVFFPGEFYGLYSIVHGVAKSWARFLLKCIHTLFPQLYHLMYLVVFCFSVFCFFFLFASFFPSWWVSWIATETTESQISLLIVVHTWSLGASTQFLKQKLPWVSSPSVLPPLWWRDLWSPSLWMRHCPLCLSFSGKIYFII